MKIISIMALILVFVLPSTSAASPRVGQRSMGICTSDFNLWGNASQCSCDKEEIYDERAGLCLTNEEGEEITVQGSLAANIAAIGGETTGFVLKISEEESYELILKVADQEKVKALDGPWFEVTGERIIIESVEMGQRRAIIVKTFTVLEALLIKQ